VRGQSIFRKAVDSEIAALSRVAKGKLFALR
jgi:hypothetical protein